VLKFTDSSNFAFSITDGGAAHSYTKSAPFSVTSNVAFNVSATVTPPHTSTTPVQNAPGTFACSTTLDGATQAPAVDPYTGVLTITISGLDYSTATNGNYNTGGSTVITVVAAS